MELTKVFITLSLCSWAAATSTNCSDLVRYLKPEDVNLVLGEWTVVIAVADESLQGTLKQRSSSWFELIPFLDSGVVQFNWRERVEGACTYGSENGTLYKDRPTLAIESEGCKGLYLHTCPDCYLSTTKAEVNGVSGRYFILAKREGNLTASEQQLFETQAGCLGFPSSFSTFTNPSELCPEKEKPVSTQ